MCYPADAGRHGVVFFAKALRVQTGCANEPAMFKGYPEMVRPAKEKGEPFVGLVTNARLPAEANIDAPIVRGLDSIAMSVHGVASAAGQVPTRNASPRRPPLGSRDPGWRDALASSPVFG
jgi:hypothetical protein